jgi:CRISPR/Cas system-associated exonuclease Cas4 (RecB family)
LTRGAIFHAVQFRFFNAAKEHSLLPFREKKLAWTLDLLDRIVNEVAAEYEEQLAPAIERVWRTEIDNLRADLRAWVIDSIPEHVEWTPWRFEYGFGLQSGAGHDESSREEPAILETGLRLRGSIDLVETNGTTLRVTDHKTGRAQAAPAYIGGGEVLQPVLYAMAAEVLFGKPVVSGRLYFCTQRGGYCRDEVSLSERARKEVDRLVRHIDKSIQTGFLPAAPKEGACELCDFQCVCGPYEQERVRRKEPDALDGLVEIRNAP